MTLSHATKRGKRIFERQYDSGVFLGSDGMEMDEPMDGPESTRLSTSLPVRTPRGSQILVPEEPTPEVLARQKIHVCIEYGTEQIDLS